MAAARGRFPLSTDSGAATSWFQPGEVPLPDREYGTLWWWALAGLNHFYLRSVLPGLFKAGLLIVGGLLAIARSPTAFLPIVGFGVWWAWDLLQLATEKERVIAYGMTTPFDYTTGIGQGMIVDGQTNYRQRADFVGWQLMSVLGPLGVDALLQGRPGLFVRKLIDTILFSSFASGLFKGLWNGDVSDAVLSFLFLFTALFGFFVLLPWITTVGALGHPTTMFTEGIKISPAFEKFLNFFDSWTGGFGPNTQSEVRRDFGIASIPGADLRRDFKIYRHDPAAPAEEKEKGAGGQQEQTTWPMSVGLGNAITGPIAALVAKFILMFRYGMEAYYAAADLATTAKELAKDGPAALAERAKGELAARAKGAIGGLTAQAKEALSGVATRAAEEAGIELTPLRKQDGGGSSDTAPSWESVILGATVAALAAGGAIKAAVDYLVHD
jgi:hypothetical protein